MCEWVGERPEEKSLERFIIQPLCILPVTWQLTAELVEASPDAVFCFALSHWLHFSDKHLCVLTRFYSLTNYLQWALQVQL